jgi:hypothetical protein
MNPAADWITQIVDVDPEEAQILIDLVELLFEDWYVARNDRTKHLAKIRSIAEERNKSKSRHKNWTTKCLNSQDRMLR